MDEYVGWVATALTTIAALMVALNLGARVTGYGFVVFTVGSVAWIVVALLTDQSSLMWQNIALLAINLAGIWRWLGLHARYARGAAAADPAAP